MCVLILLPPLAAFLTVFNTALQSPVLSLAGWLAVYRQITQTGFYNQSDWLAGAALARVQAVIITLNAVTLAARCCVHLDSFLSRSASVSPVSRYLGLL